ncbi:hypothetical protein OFB65_27105, partial [Escherichia coli]|nr:hypothetical protein [Escherichia coli]
MSERKISTWNPEILRRATFDAFRKLDPRLMVKNPVMFVVEVGSVLLSVSLARDLLVASGERAAF